MNDAKARTKIGALDLTPQLFLEISQGFKAGGARRFIVKENALPNDAEIVRIGLSPHRPDVVRLYIQSDSFIEVAEGAEPPELPLIVFETVFDKDAERLDAIYGCDRCDLCDDHADYIEGRIRKHEAHDKYRPICIHCGLADIAGDWETYACNDEWRKVIATNY